MTRARCGNASSVPGSGQLGAVLPLGLAPVLNGAQPSALLRGPLAPDPAAAELLGVAIAAGRLSARGADRAIRVAWSLADLAGVRAARHGAHRTGTDTAG